MDKKSKGASGTPIWMVVGIVAAIVIAVIVIIIISDNNNVFMESLGNVGKFVNSLTG